jgi:hypothetical protein
MNRIVRLEPWLVVPGLLVIGCLWLPAQDFAPPAPKKVDAATVKVIAEKATALGKKVAFLRKKGVGDPWLADVEVYLQAASWIVGLNEFFDDKSADWTLEALDRGMLRAALLTQGQFPPPPWLMTSGSTVVRGYRSPIDGSVQPYAVTLPAAYGDPQKKWRLDIVLHGRDTRLNEIKFLHLHNGDQAAPKGDNFIRLDIFGRGNNSYRWAGEKDVFDATDHFIRVEKGLNRDFIDLERVVLRGFSMGGAGTWHIGLHKPDRFCVIGPGAGFTTTHGYVPKLPAKLPSYQEKCLHIYDAVDYALNAFNVPVVAYSGSEDPQKQAADNIEARLKKLGLAKRMTHLIAEDLAHTFPADWRKKAEALYAKHVEKGRTEYPERVRFVTYTLRYPSCSWVDIMSLDKHFARAEVDARQTKEGFHVKTSNVKALRLTLAEGAPPKPTVMINDQEVHAKPWITPNGQYHVFLMRGKNGWRSVLPQVLFTARERKLQKFAGLQGPIDDAFTEGFLCVRGTDKPWHQGTQKYADLALERYQAEWAKFWRGQLPIKEDVDITNEDIAGKHLILFGDPASNSLIAQVLPALPMTWTKDQIVVAGKKCRSEDHMPVMIYPSPLNSSRYVVLNTGHTFHTPDYVGTNALLYPRLGDYALLRLAPTDRDILHVDVVTAGLFDDYWQYDLADRNEE